MRWASRVGGGRCVGQKQQLPRVKHGSPQVGSWKFGWQSDLEFAAVTASYTEGRRKQGGILTAQGSHSHCCTLGWTSLEA